MQEIVTLAHQAGFDHVGKVNTASLVARSEVRDMCAAGRCGAYGKSWSCPPACGSIEHCQKRMKSSRIGQNSTMCLWIWKSSYYIKRDSWKRLMRHNSVCIGNRR